MSDIVIQQFITKDFKALDSKDRLFEGYLTVEVVDKQGEITIRDELLKTLPVWIKRGGPISDTHTNRIVGRGLNFWPDIFKDEDGVEYPAIKILGQIYDDTELDNRIWKKILSKEYKGLSFGGATKSGREPVKQSDGSIAYNLKDLEMYEVAVCADPAVPFALITDVNMIAKSVSSERMAGMNMQQRGDGSMCIRCKGVKCFIENTDNYIRDKSSNLINNMETQIESKKDETSKETSTFNVDQLKKDIVTEIVTALKQDKKDEKEDEKEDKKSIVANKESDKKEDMKDDKKDEKKSDVDRLAELLTKYVDGNEKKFSELQAKIDKALETAPALNPASGSEVKIPTALDAGVVSTSSQGSMNPQDANSTSETDESAGVKIEAKSKSNEATQSGDIITKTIRPPGVGEDVGNYLLKSGRTAPSDVLKEARQVGYNGLGEIAKKIRNDEYPGMKQESEFKWWA